MKALFLRIVFLSALSIPLTGRSQPTEKWNTFTITQSIDQSNLNSKRLFKDKSKAKSLENNLANFYLFKDSVQVKPGGHWKYDFFAAGCLCFKYDDTLLFSSGLGRSEGIGVALKVYQDRFSSSLHVNSRNALEYKSTLADSSFSSDLLIQPIRQSLKLTQEPTGSSDIMIGEYNGTFRNFYQKSLKSGRIYVRKYRVRLIFKCKITGINNIKN
jgi:hypothetical protein